jgi:hypothetical protein
VAATVAVSDAAERGHNAVRELDAIVRNIFRDDPAALAEWESASHVERPPPSLSLPYNQSPRARDEQS